MDKVLKHLGSLCWLSLGLQSTNVDLKDLGSLFLQKSKSIYLSFPMCHYLLEKHFVQKLYLVETYKKIKMIYLNYDLIIMTLNS